MYPERASPDLSKYEIRFAISLVVVEIRAVIEKSLFLDFCSFFALFSYN
jgi:hypothetical protein